MTQQDKTSTEFWKHKRLSQMNHQQWESLCDGCGRCCLHKLEDEDDGTVYYTRAACELLDIKTCRCTDYENRKRLMPDCIQLNVEQAEYFNWLPETCAYRLLAEGEALPEWHPLITGDADSVIKAGISVRNIAKPDCDPENLFPEIISFSMDLKMDSDEA
ncbi:MAG: YcgN family cysteine cluster protein [Gammaproteobacteria bacterium]|nr:MAG: YcgN family cysteine cluster protein [Gammaproteobacteria bacterium]RKZ93919.1 MAG: YcgN family cysteine cluster protein [Gammaproteobacteria bacterium]RKZ94611.1 MAG: YcgN family cysteine cluster protein [Gammaproteobacteria bacterium]RKZ99262.1 MAG: YcgN family cysteine cluster protein [Gammaproteobacteria bacterium]